MILRSKNCPNPDCKHPMKMFAAFCPKCGTESRSRKSYIFTVLTFVVIIVIVTFKGSH
jgi:hypothetical protein